MSALRQSFPGGFTEWALFPLGSLPEKWLIIVLMGVFFILCFLGPVFSLASDVSGQLNSSLQLLLNSGELGGPYACFDYKDDLPTVIRTRASDCERGKTIPKGSYRTGRYGNYSISRTGEKSYQALLNLDFVPTLNPPSGRAGDQALADKMLQRTRNCLKEMKPYFKGPKGEELEIVVVTSSDKLPFGVPRPVPVGIGVSYQDENFRGHFSNFGSNFQCETIGHEILHHLGLCDEYYEGVISGPGFNNDDWGCRVVTAELSYMRNMRLAYQLTLPTTAKCECNLNCQKIMKNPKARSIFLQMNGEELMGTEVSLTSANDSNNPNREVCKQSAPIVVEEKDVPDRAFIMNHHSQNKTVFTSYRAFSGQNIFYDKIVYECECKPHMDFCPKLLEKVKKYAENVPQRVTCPSGLKSHSNSGSIGFDEKGTRVDCKNDRCELILTSKGSGESLLHPAHFNQILAGDCSEYSHDYNLCSRYAYMSISDPICKFKPAKCNDDTFYLNSPQSR